MSVCVCYCVTAANWTVKLTTRVAIRLPWHPVIRLSDGRPVCSLLRGGWVCGLITVRLSSVLVTSSTGKKHCPPSLRSANSYRQTYEHSHNTLQYPWWYNVWKHSLLMPKFSSSHSTLLISTLSLCCQGTKAFVLHISASVWTIETLMLHWSMRGLK